MDEMKEEIFSKELAEKIKKCLSADEIIAVGKEFNIPLTQEQAEVQMQHLTEFRARRSK
ncbi:MAG: hypothetical protein PHS97_01055 [Oscillospiraceae bacterium]|nr:hypothetical protein [Oscillospiraceae bacterium]